MRQGGSEMKTAYFLLLPLVLALFALGCSEDVERENLLDAHNERTGGAPPGMVARAGCGALCPEKGQPCLACRGLVDHPNIKSALEILVKHGRSSESARKLMSIYPGVEKLEQMFSE